MRLAGVHLIVAGVLALGGNASANQAIDGAIGTAESQETVAWPAGAAAEEPIQLVVSVPEQRVSVYVGSELVAESPVSTGRKGYGTPTGVFSILEKKKYHRSNIYSRAPMPFMQRLTWSGIALHASNDVPDHPASHGCVRLPADFAKKLYGFTEVGAHVIISSEADTPLFEVHHPNLFQPLPPSALAAETGIGGRYVSPDSAASAVEAAGDPSPLRILVTRRTGRELVRDVQTLLIRLGFDPGEVDGWMGRNTGTAIAAFQESRGLSKTGAMSEELVAQLYDAAGLGDPPTGHLYVRRDFEPVFDAPVSIAEPDKPLGAHLFTAMDFDDDTDQVRWLAVTVDDGVADLSLSESSADMTAAALTPSTAANLLGRIDIPASVRQRISRMLTPGSSLAISDGGISRETVARGSDFVVLTR